MQEAIQLYNNCCYIKAKQLFELELEKDANNIEALVYMGNIYGNIDKYKAKIFYQRAFDNGASYALIKIADLFMSPCYCFHDIVDSDNDFSDDFEEDEDDKDSEDNYQNDEEDNYIYFSKAQLNEYYIKARELLEKDMTNAINLYYVGYLNYHGLGISRNRKIGKKLIGKAAKTGYIDAIMEIGNIYSSIYRHNSADDKDLKSAEFWYNKGVELNYSNALIALHNLKQIGKEATKYLEEAANLGNSEAMTMLANCDKNKKLLYLEKAAELLDLKAIEALSNLEYNKKNYNKSLEYRLQIFKLTDNIKILSDAQPKIMKLLISQYISFKKDIKKLTNENIELKYQPGGPGYHEAKHNFESLACNN